MGLGYVGLPLACEFARAGFPVTGYDVDARRGPQKGPLPRGRCSMTPMCRGSRPTSSPLTTGALRRADSVVIVTDHACFDIPGIVSQAPLVVDCRNATRGISSPKIVRL
jgi:UDP-N-acetyl-D-mannosaminuronate dehydrogenase